MEIFLDIVGKHRGRHIALTMGAQPYLWIGDAGCYGCVPDNKVQELRDMCNAILETRESPRKRGKTTKK